MHTTKEQSRKTRDRIDALIDEAQGILDNGRALKLKGHPVSSLKEMSNDLYHLRRNHKLGRVQAVERYSIRIRRHIARIEQMP